MTIVDAGEGNDLMGMAIVYYPACPEARAQTLVAEVDETDAFKSVFASANVCLAELDIEVVRGKVWELFERKYRDDVWCLRVLLLCPDCVIYYDKDGHTWKVEYRVEDNEMYVTDWYEVEFARTQRGEIGMDNEKMIARNEIASSEVSVDEEKNMETVAPEVVEEKKQEEEVIVERAKERDDSRCAELSAQVDALIKENESLKAEIEKYRAEEVKREEERILAEREQKKTEMIAFAEKNGLNTKDEHIAAAIENMDYAYLMAQSMSAKPVRESDGASLRMSAEIGVSDPYGGLLKRA